ncbi:copper resistance CopC/CopD family protein [Paenibacillus thermotolerans]|uniref:copper resistance CopC/CopD family protein n=1 Tax=Paenibacillus thermotolerans TaxID=3027807 RepID=UPI0023687678|nr:MULTISPECIES: copper resistance protein CopC [unclassified Paenibacillus]
MTFLTARTIRKRVIAAAVCLIAACFAASPGVSAHTKLKQSVPAEGEVMESAPPEIRLTFSGKLEDALHTVTLTPEGGEAVPLNEPALDESGTALSVPLPGGLANGAYTIYYRAVSADGHPVEGNIGFELRAPEPAPAGEPAPSVEEPAETAEPEKPGDGGAPAAPADPGATDEDHSGHAGHEEQPAMPEKPASKTGDAFLGAMYTSSAIYYVTLLALAGWALWSLLYRWGESDAEWRAPLGIWLQALHLAAFLLLAALQWADVQAGGGLDALLNFVRTTDIGRSWLFTLLLSAAGFALLFRYRYVDASWAALLIAAKTLRGHSGMTDSVALSRLFDGIHLAAASLWVGGLLTLLVLLRRNRERLAAFVPAFSTAALLAFAVLAATGIVQAMWISKHISVILATGWGTLLIAKLMIVLLVLPVAFILRRSFAAGKAGRFQGWLRADIVLLAAVIAVTGALTHTSPVPPRDPLHWHVMGETIHMTANVSPNLPGRNDTEVLVWVPEGEGVPAAVTAVIRDEANNELAVEMARVENSEDVAMFPGFDRYGYKGKLRMKHPDRETLVIIVVRATGERVVYEKKLSEP